MSESKLFEASLIFLCYWCRCLGFLYLFMEIKIVHLFVLLAEELDLNLSSGICILCKLTHTCFDNDFQSSKYAFAWNLILDCQFFFGISWPLLAI